MASLGETGDAPVIRIVKKKGGGGGHHGGAWKVAYADFVTAMMAFFLVMWIVGLNKPTRQAIAAYFQHPTLVGAGTGKSVISSESPPPSAKPPAITPDDKAKIQIQLKAKAEAILNDLKKSPEFNNLRDSVQVRLTDEGLRIELLEKTSSLFFGSGSAKLNPKTVKLLQVIAQELREVKSPIIVEGHTDSRPLGGANGYSNWELSSDRANAARRAMSEHGLRPGQIIGVRGYADRKLLKPDDPMHFSNRRVSILVANTGGGSAE